jgi:hypothetical protein
LTDDEAFTQARGLDATAFGDAWLASVGAVAPTRYGPEPAAAGPVPQAWSGSPAPRTTAAPGAATAVPSTGGSPGSVTSGSAGAVLVVVVIGVTFLAVAGLYGWRRRQDAAEA